MDNTAVEYAPIPKNIAWPRETIPPLEAIKSKLIAKIDKIVISSPDLESLNKAKESYGGKIETHKRAEDLAKLNSSHLLAMHDSFGNIEKWRLAMGYTINVNRLPLRVGMSYGGYDKKSFSFGSGFHFKKVHLDFGLSFKGAMNFSKTNGIDFGINMNLINL